ncbi:MAG: ribonuclease P protein component [Bacteroidaceae bacterium]|nr:ribonuclease P protein component [Bacteroidaceae bacterium]
MEIKPQGLKKEERLTLRRDVEALFEPGHQSFSAFPLRAVFLTTEESGVRILVSVSKRHFKRAVRRNHIKRQLREAFRKNKSLLAPARGGVHIAFLWSSNQELTTASVETRMQNLLKRINERLLAPATP